MFTSFGICGHTCSILRGCIVRGEKTDSPRRRFLGWLLRLSLFLAFPCCWCGARIVLWHCPLITIDARAHPSVNKSSNAGDRAQSTEGQIRFSFPHVLRQSFWHCVFLSWTHRPVWIGYILQWYTTRPSCHISYISPLLYGQNNVVWVPTGPTSVRDELAI